MVLPLCRCRVLYIGSAVPTITKDGLQGIQQPLRERYPVEDTPETRGIDSCTLHYCAAVRYVNVSGYAVEGGGERFLPLDSPFADLPDSPHPPIFAAILRRTTGVKVLECHGFICSNAKAANALVRCCFHAYADCMYLKMEEKLPGLKSIKNQEGSTGERSPTSPNSDEDISVEAEDHPDRREPSGWDRRQQEGEYDSVSISSSMLRNNKASSESGARHHALVPFDAAPRRSGSDADLSSFRDHRFPPFMPAPPHRLPPGMLPPPHPMLRPPPFPFFPPPPPGHFPPPPPGVFRGPPPFLWGPPPPHHRGFFHPPPFMPPFRPPSPTEGSGPIITGPESIYGTMRRSAYEEPAYVGGGPPESSYQPSNFNHDQYETYYDTLKKKGSKKGSVSGKDIWEQYEAGIYRKPHINERAFSNTLKETAEKDTMSATLKRGGREETSTQTATAEIIRPDTPPVDYESRNGVRAH